MRDAWLDFTGQVAVVAGGGGAIGSAIAAQLAERGAAVHILDAADHQGPAGTRTIGCDVSDAGAVGRAIDAIDRDAGRIDLLVHAAGITRDGRLWKLTDEDWNAVQAVNLASAFYLLRAVVPVMRRRSAGAIVLVSSINAERGKVGQAAYAASKAGLNALGRTAARELGGFGIRVNVVAPGWIETPMTATLPDELRQRAKVEAVLGRLGEPEDVARAVIFVGGAMGRHMTGQVLRVDGGQLIG